MYTSFPVLLNMFYALRRRRRTYTLHILTHTTYTHTLICIYIYMVWCVFAKNNAKRWTRRSGGEGGVIVFFFYCAGVLFMRMCGIFFNLSTAKASIYAHNTAHIVIYIYLAVYLELFSGAAPADDGFPVAIF